MQMDLLRKFAGMKLPTTVATRTEIEGLRELDLMGYVKAFIPPVHVDCDDCVRQDPASVIEVTPRGLQALCGDLVVVEFAATQAPQDPLPLPLDAAHPSHPHWVADAWRRIKRSVLPHAL